MHRGGGRMKFYLPIEFSDIIEMKKQKLNSGVSYCIYSEITDIDRLELDSICYLGDCPRIEEGKISLPEQAAQKGLNLLFTQETMEDVILNALHQKKSVTDGQILSAIKHFTKNNNYLKL